MILKRVLCWQKQLNRVSVFTWPDHILFIRIKKVFGVLKEYA
jgi:hypothetical protein